MIHEIRPYHPFRSVVVGSDIEAIYETHFDYVWTNLRRLGVPRSQLEDACHDVFLVAHRRADDYDQRCAIKTWLFGILRRVASDYRRRSQREQQRRARLAQALPQPVHPAEAWSGRVWMKDFLGRLKPAQREAYVMLELEQMTALEASIVSGINANTLSARLRAARSQLRDSLAAEHGAPSPRQLVEGQRQGQPAPEPSRRRVLAGLVPLWSAGLPHGSAAGGGAGTGATGIGSGSGVLGLGSGVFGIKAYVAVAAILLATVAIDSPQAAGSQPSTDAPGVLQAQLEPPVLEPEPTELPQAHPRPEPEPGPPLSRPSKTRFPYPRRPLQSNLPYLHRGPRNHRVHAKHQWLPWPVISPPRPSSRGESLRQAIPRRCCA